MDNAKVIDFWEIFSIMTFIFLLLAKKNASAGRLLAMHAVPALIG